MIKKMRTNEGIQYEKLSPEEMKAKGILGRLVGPCADFINPTRNGRKYSEQLWENVFNSPLMQEKIKNGVCFGELGHPADRTEIDMEKIAVCLRQQPMKNEKGQLCAVFDILDTPNGRILKTLCDYGSRVGVSSRGQGDLVTDVNGDEAVDPDTYDCECWDVVLVPAVEAARMDYFTEALDSKKLKLSMKKALTESLNTATEEEKKIMAETLENLNITLDEAKKDADTLSAEDIPAEDVSVEDETTVTEIPELELAAEDDAEDIEDIAPVEDDAKTSEEEEEEDTRTDEEIFLDYLANNFEDEAIKKACEALDIEIEEVEEAAEKSEESKEDKDDESEESEEKSDEDDTEEKPEEEEKKEDEKVDEALVTITSDEGTTTVDTDANKVDTEAETVNVNASKGTEEFNSELPIETEPALPLDDMELGLETAPVEAPVDDLAAELDNIGSNDESQENIDVENEETKEDAEENVEEAVDDRSEALVRGLQEALKSKSDLESSVKSLQEKLAAGDARVNELTEENSKLKSAVSRLATLAKSNKDLKESVSKLEESLATKNEEIAAQQARISRLVKSRKESVDSSASLNESLNAKSTEVRTLTEQINTLKEQLTQKENDAAANAASLKESLNKATALKESYKKLANSTINRYIETRATMIGLTATDIKRKLGESYSLADVDKVCEDLKAYQLNIARLPIAADRQVGVRVNEGSSRLGNVKPSAKNAQFDEDEVDRSLIKLANI